MRFTTRSLSLACVLACALGAFHAPPAAAAPTSADLATGSGTPVPGIPFIHRASTLSYDDEWYLTLLGTFPDSAGCWGVDSLANARFGVLLYRPDSCHSTETGQWAWSFRLGRLQPGHHSVLLRLAVDEHPGDPVPPSFYEGVFEFEVPRDTIPPPPGLPYVDRVVISPADGTRGPLCPDDSIRVTLQGHFPNGCYDVRGIELVPTPIPGDPPAVRVVVDRGNCNAPCPEIAPLWEASIVQAPRRAGRHSQTIILDEVDCAVPDSLVGHHAARVPFAVSDQCAQTPSCLRGGFVRSRLPDSSAVACDAFVAPGDPGQLTFGVLTFEDLAGLQGSFSLYPAGLRITGIETVGAAQSMRLDWVPTTNGARFTLFAESGAPILACPDLGLCIPQPILRLTVAAETTLTQRTALSFHDLLGSTVDGAGVPECPVMHLDPARIAFPGAWICPAGGECDFNADGRSDIRDLVLMVHCVNQTGTCPPGGAFDCNGDAHSSLADVICCARHILRRNPVCPECPPDTLRPAPQVRASLGQPVHSETGVEVPLSIVGAEHLGGVLVELSFPADRYEIDADLLEQQSTGGWWDLYEVEDGKLAIGLVRIGPVTTTDVDQRLQLAVRLRLRPGQEPGGEIACRTTEFSAADGALLAVSLGALSQPLSGPARLQLSNARPNPSSGASSFALTLDRPSDVEVGVFDLGGRRIATVHRGRLGPGEHVMRWEGRGDDGLAAPSGVYFYRATAGVTTASRKLVLMRER